MLRKPTTGGLTMKKQTLRSLCLSLFILASLVISLAGYNSAQAAPRQQDPTQAPTEAPTATTAPAATEAPTAAAPTNERPIVLIESYYMDVDSVSPGKDFNLFLTLSNRGQNTAINVLIGFTPGDLIPRATGGSLAVSILGPGESKTVKQPMSISSSITGGGISSIAVNVGYTDEENNNQYTAAFNIALRVNYPSYAPAAPTPTPTQVNILKPQLSISSYQADTDPLQPGQPFNLTLEIRNLGNGDAKGVTMITGGGTGGSGGYSGTPEPGGVSGSSGEFTNFAPLKSSNIHFIGDLPSGKVTKVDQSLIVNTTTQPGAYSLKFSFVYVDNRGVRFVDDQVITLLVYQLPLVEITFYRDAGPFFPGQPGALPIQITNLSRKPTILGNLKATVKSGGTVTNNVTLIGAMDPGGYFTLDASLIPDQSGPMDIDITVSYTDDFNQPQTINQTLPVTVMDQPVIPPDGGVPGGDGGYVEPTPFPTTPETFVQKVVRFFKGLVGLGSAQPQAGGMDGKGPVVEPGTSQPIPGGKPIIVPPMKGG